MGEIRDNPILSLIYVENLDYFLACSLDYHITDSEDGFRRAQTSALPGLAGQSWEKPSNMSELNVLTCIMRLKTPTLEHN